MTSVSEQGRCTAESGRGLAGADDVAELSRQLEVAVPAIRALAAAAAAPPATDSVTAEADRAAALEADLDRMREETAALEVCGGRSIWLLIFDIRQLYSSGYFFGVNLATQFISFSRIPRPTSPPASLPLRPRWPQRPRRRNG